MLFAVVLLVVAVVALVLVIKVIKDEVKANEIEASASVERHNCASFAHHLEEVSKDINEICIPVGIRISLMEDYIPRGWHMSSKYGVLERDAR